MNYLWLVASISCSLLWGFGNFVRRNIHHVPTFELGILYAIILFGVNVSLFYYFQNPISKLIIFSDKKTGALSILYCLLFSLANILSLFAVKMDWKASSKIYIVSSTYPLVTALLTYFLLDNTMKLHYLVGGGAMVVLGCALIGLA